MAGHSHFANIKHKKGLQDKKKSKLFTKLIREIVVAAKSGLPDPNFNPRLRLALVNARVANVTRDRIENAIKKATEPHGGENYEQLRYEGYGAGGTALIVETLSDNRNRTASDVRSTFSKFGGNLGETGSVNFMFDRLGSIRFPKDKSSDDAMLEAAIEAGADNCESDELSHEITCNPDNFHAVQKFLTDKFGDPENSVITWKPKNFIELDLEKAEQVEELIERLEDLDDVQKVYSNHTFSDEVAEKLVAKMG
jgi:YebC/PmpR family DNA-binding regulatory protein